MVACGGDDGATGNGSTTSSSGSSTTTAETSTGTPDTSSSAGSGTSSDGTGSSSSGSTSTTAGESSSSGGTSSGTDSTTGSTTGGLEPEVVINELSSNNDGVLGADPIELYNAGDVAVDLSGWILTDDLLTPDDPYDPLLDDEELVFADGTTLEAGAFLVVVRGDVAGAHPFGLSGGGDTVTLLSPTLTVIDFVAYGADEAAVSYCRLPDGPAGTWQAACAETFGASNS